jgi:diguanylate cyclase (GGDEF)-like protein
MRPKSRDSGPDAPPSPDKAPLNDLRHLLGDLARGIAACKDHGQHLAVLCVDVDRFRAVLGSLSPSDYEQLLFDIAGRLKEGIRSDDLLIRPGCDEAQVSVSRIRGEEFCLLVQNLSEAAHASAVGRRLLDSMAQPFRVAGRETWLTTSVGIATYPTDDLPPEELVKAAENAAYCARQETETRLVFYRASMNARAFERQALEASLRQAVERDQLVLHYQPRVEIQSGRVVGVEALLRWNHPELGQVSPLQFIPLAEETGLIVPIGQWVLKTACEQNRRWQDEGLPPIRMAVNLSCVQFRQRGLFESVEQALAAAHLEPEWLELEITESSLMQDADSAIALLHRLKERGIHLSIDDFGTGYSSLSYLKRFPIDALKIDQSFVRDLTTNPDDSAIATAIILLGRSLKLRVVAEGVESRSQLALLRVLRCDEIQGYLVSRPVPAAELAPLLSGPVPALSAA